MHWQFPTFLNTGTAEVVVILCWGWQRHVCATKSLLWFLRTWRLAEPENPKPWYWHTYSVHYDDVIMGVIASQITSLIIVNSAVYSGADQSKHQSSASLAFVWGIHRGPVNSPHKWPVTRKMFPFDDVIMNIPVSAPERLKASHPLRYETISFRFGLGCLYCHFQWIYGVYLSISFKVASLALRQSYDCPNPNASGVTFKYMC